MPLEFAYITKIASACNLKTEDYSKTPSSFLGTALRRMCDKKRAITWEQQIYLVNIIANELFKSDYQELLKKNTQGFNAPQCATRSLLAHARSRRPDLSTITNMLFIIAGLTQFIMLDDLRLDVLFTSEDLALRMPIEEFVLKYEKYAMQNRVSAIPEDQACYFAIDSMIIQTARNVKAMYRGLEAIAQTSKSDIKKLKDPLILLSSHTDSGPADFFEQYTADLVTKGYGLFCIELPFRSSIENYMELKTSGVTKDGQLWATDEDGTSRITVMQRILRGISRARGIVQFIDPITDGALRHITIWTAISRKYLMHEVLMHLRNIGMAYATEMYALKYNTSPVFLVGASHYSGLQPCFTEMLCRNPRFFILTANLPQLMKQNKTLITNIKEKVPVVDLSKPESIKSLDLALPINQQKINPPVAKIGM